MRLKPVRTYTDVSREGRGRGELHAALTACTSYYHQTMHQPIEVWPLIVQVAQRFIEPDREFQKWRRRTRNGRGTRPVAS
jgi:hypothetical protein